MARSSSIGMCYSPCRPPPKTPTRCSNDGVFTHCLEVASHQDVEGVIMNTTQVENKAIVTAFYELAFNQHNPAEAARKYIAYPYMQHNPDVPDRPEGFNQFAGEMLKKYPDWYSIRRTGARSVAISSRSTTSCTS